MTLTDFPVLMVLMYKNRVLLLTKRQVSPIIIKVGFSFDVFLNLQKTQILLF